MPNNDIRHEASADVLVIGGGLGGVSAALAAAALGATVILTDEFDWLGGQLTTQGVPLDEYPWNETVIFSQSYFRFRSKIRKFYRDHYPLTPEARANPLLNPGMGNSSTLSHEPQVSVHVLDLMLMPDQSAGKIRILRRHKPVTVEADGDTISAVTVLDLNSGNNLLLFGRIVIDATETGTLLELGHIEHVLGAESQAETGEPHAISGAANPLNQTAVSWAFAADYLPGEDHVIDRPASYSNWRDQRPKFLPDVRFSWMVADHVTHKPRQRPLFAGDSDEEYLFDLWHARRYAYRKNFLPGAYKSDITFGCWPQNEYWDKPMIGVSQQESAAALREAREVSLSFFYWIQTEAPRHDGGIGYRGLRLRGDVLGTNDGLAKQPYYREGRRIKSECTLLEQHIGVEARGNLIGAERFDDSIGVCAYRMDLHYSTVGGGTVDLDTYPFQIPLGSLLPIRVDNLLPACKNLGTTRLTNGSCRVHPAEWSIGEASGTLAAFALAKNVPPRGIRSDPKLLREFQERLTKRGVMLRWPVFGPLLPSARIGYRPPPG